MYPLLATLAQDTHFTGNTASDVYALLTHHNCAPTWHHSQHVAIAAHELASQFGAAAPLAEKAGWLHDISAVLPSPQRLQAARDLDLPILPEEESCPMILHQKLSAAMARELFGVSEQAVLDAIGCHTTLRANATPLDKVVFLADKIRWDRAGQPPYLGNLLAALAHSLDAAVLCYLTYLWQQRHTLPVIHPWLVAAYRQLSRNGEALASG